MVNDWVLETLVVMAEKGASTPITLTTNGATVSGMIIPEATFLRELGNSLDRGFVAALGDIAANRIGTTFRDAADQLEERARNPPPEAEDEAHIKPITLIHLSDARYVSDSPPPRDAGFLWRGEISQVVGWHFGIVVGRE